MMVGTLVNTGTVIAGSLIGLLLGNILPERLRDTVMKGLGLCTLFIGVTGMLDGSNTLITIISIAVGAVIGELCDLDGHLNRFAEGLEKKFQKNKAGQPSLAEGFITASLVFCVGAMTIVGALNDGLTGNHEMLFTKATLDFVSSMIFASSLGIGVLMAAAAVLVIEGGIACLASLVAPLLQQTGSKPDRRNKAEGHELRSGNLPAYPAVPVYVSLHTYGKSVCIKGHRRSFSPL